MIADYKKGQKMKLEAVFLFILIVVFSLTVAGCVRTAATWQPGQIPAAAISTQATEDSNYTVGMLRLTPAQNGTDIPVSYAITDNGDSIDCKIIFDQFSTGGSGAVSWMLKNISNVDGEFSVKASIADSNGAPIALTSGDINVKLKRDNAYILGDTASYTQLTELIPILNSQLTNQYSGDIITYELDWQKNNVASQDKTTGKITLSITFILVESQSNH
jgi:hypothetical protein